MYALKVLRFNDMYDHSYWSVFNTEEKEIQIFNERDRKLEKFLRKNKVITFDGEYLIGKYGRDLGTDLDIVPLDVIFYLLLSEKFEIYNILG